MRNYEKANKAMSAILTDIDGLSGEDVGDICSGLIAVAGIRMKNECGPAEAATLMSDLASHASAIGSDFRKKSASVK